MMPRDLARQPSCAAVCGAELEGDVLGSQMVTLTPGGAVHPGEYVFDVTEAAEDGSAGSVGLVLQTVLLPLAPAIAAAVYDATGVWFDQLPLTPERVALGLREVREG